MLLELILKPETKTCVTGAEVPLYNCVTSTFWVFSCSLSRSRAISGVIVGGFLERGGDFVVVGAGG